MKVFKKVIGLSLTCLAFLGSFSTVFADSEYIDYGDVGANNIAKMYVNGGGSLVSASSTTYYKTSGSTIGSAKVIGMSGFKISENGTAQRWSMDLNSSSGAYGTLAKKSNSIYSYSGSNLTISGGSDTYNLTTSKTTTKTFLNDFLTGYDISANGFDFVTNPTTTSKYSLLFITDAVLTSTIDFKADDVVLFMTSLVSTTFSKDSSKTYYLYCFNYSLRKEESYNLKFPVTDSNYFKPVFYGSYNDIPSSYYFLLYGTSKGTNVDFSADSNFSKDSTGTSSQLDTKTSIATNRINKMNNLESTYSKDMTSNFGNISSSDVSIVSDSSFLNSAQWVTSQFNNLVDVEISDGKKPFNMVLFYSLFLGIALIVIGKVKS